MQGSGRRYIGNVALPLTQPLPNRTITEPQKQRRSQQRPQSRQRQQLRLNPARLAVTIVIVLGLLSLIAVRQVAITGMGYEIESMKGQVKSLQAEQATIESQMAQVAAPQRIEQAALGMGMVESEQLRIARVERLQAQHNNSGQTEQQAVVMALPSTESANAGNVQHQAKALPDRVSEWLFALFSGQHVLADSSH